MAESLYWGRRKFQRKWDATKDRGISFAVKVNGSLYKEMSINGVKGLGLMKFLTVHQPLYYEHTVTNKVSSTNKSLPEIVTELEHHSTSSRGSAPAKEIDKAAKLLKSSGNGTLKDATALLDIGTNTAIELALLILPTELGKDSKKVFDILLKYADHENWEIREYAGEMIGEFLRYNFRNYKKRLIHLRRSDSENIRRSVVIGLKYLGKYRELSLSQDILEILGWYMDDESNYVKKNLGPFAIGDAMIEYDSAHTLTCLRRWTLHSNPNVKWNVASVFSTAAGAKYCDVGVELLGKLIYDDDMSVRQMALKSFKNLYQRNTSQRPAIKKLLLPIIEKATLPQKQFNFLEG